MQRPPPTLGIRHLALQVTNMTACRRFYIELLGMHIEWEPDPENVYLSSGSDNLALHQAKLGFDPTPDQRLDHLGILVQSPERVDEWYGFLCAHHVEIVKPPKTHRDGARSFYCLDPDRNTVQIIYHPPIA